MSTVLTEHQSDQPSEDGRPIKGGTVTWACNPGFPPAA